MPLNNADAAPDVAVILAAGMGSRIAPLGAPAKPLVRLGRHTLAHHVLDVIRRGAGIERFIIVLGHASDLVSRHFGEVGAALGVRVDFVIGRDWRRGNGASCLAAKDFVGGRRFLLSMTDHMFEPALVERLAGAAPPEDGLVLAVDFDKANVFDLEDVTRVKTDGDGRIVSIAKMLDDWDGSDTGLFHCTPGLFAALEAAAAADRHGLSDGVKRLADAGLARTVDVSGLWWMDVDTPEALAAAEKQRQRLTQR